MKILLTIQAPSWFLDKLKASGHEIISITEGEYLDEKAFCAGIRDIDVYIAGGQVKCTSRVIDSAGKLKAIIFPGVDYKPYIDVDAATQKKIPILNTPGVNSQATAEMTFLLILLAARKGAKMILQMQNKHWKLESGFQLKGKTLGIIGSGKVAQIVAEIANGFSMRTRYWTRSGEKQEMLGEYTDLRDLLKESNVLSLHVPQEAGTLIGKSEFALMPSGTILINTSPASLVDCDALYQALDEGKIKCAAFDPFYSERASAWTCPESKLFNLGPEKFIQLPHAAWLTEESKLAVFNMVFEHVQNLG